MNSGRAPSTSSPGRVGPQVGQNGKNAGRSSKKAWGTTEVFARRRGKRSNCRKQERNLLRRDAYFAGICVVNQLHACWRRRNLWHELLLDQFVQVLRVAPFLNVEHLDSPIDGSGVHSLDRALLGVSGCAEIVHWRS